MVTQGLENESNSCSLFEEKPSTTNSIASEKYFPMKIISKKDKFLDRHSTPRKNNNNGCSKWVEDLEKNPQPNYKKS